MGKIILILITIFTLTGCDNTSNREFREFRARMDNNTITNMTKYHFNYNGHQYIMFIPYTALQHNTVVHDPDCPCLKQ